MGLQINSSVQLATDQGKFPSVTFYDQSPFPYRYWLHLICIFYLILGERKKKKKEEKEILNFEKHLNILT